MRINGTAFHINRKKLYIPVIVAIPWPQPAVQCALPLADRHTEVVGGNGFVFIWLRGLAGCLGNQQRFLNTDTLSLWCQPWMCSITEEGVLHLLAFLSWSTSLLCFELSGKLCWSYFIPEYITKNLRKMLLCFSDLWATAETVQKKVVAF